MQIVNPLRLSNFAVTAILCSPTSTVSVQAGDQMSLILVDSKSSLLLVRARGKSADLGET